MPAPRNVASNSGCCAAAGKSLKPLPRHAGKGEEHGRFAALVRDVVEERAEAGPRQRGAGVGDRLHERLGVQLGRQPPAEVVQRLGLVAGLLLECQESAQLLLRPLALGDVHDESPAGGGRGPADRARREYGCAATRRRRSQFSARYSRSGQRPPRPRRSATPPPRGPGPRMDGHDPELRVLEPALAGESRGCFRPAG